MAGRTIAAAALGLSAAALGGIAPAAPAAPGERLPLAVVETERRILDDPEVDGTMRIVAGGRTRVRGPIGIEVRGNTSQLYPKKQYSIEFRDRDGDGRDVRPLGLPADDDWVLQGPYGDKTLMRNVIAYRTARSMGHYASRTRFVEARINGNYAGVYVLMEPLELGGRRVDGDWLVEMVPPDQLDAGEASLPSLTGQRLVMADPDADEAGPRTTRAVRRALARAEGALYGPGFADPARGWRAHIDGRTAVDHVLLQELLKNQDAFRSSLYVHRRGDGPLRLGPAWDFDIAMGNSSTGEGSRPEGWITTGRPWAGRLLQDPGFARAVAARWGELRAAGLREHLLGAIGAAEARLAGAQARNFTRWRILGEPVWPAVDPAAAATRPDHRSEVAALRAWLDARVAWIDANVEGLAP